MPPIIHDGPPIGLVPSRFGLTTWRATDRLQGSGKLVYMPELVVDGVKVSYHVAGSGPVCLVHSGGPGIHYDYLRMPELEQQLTMVYLEPVGTGASDLLADGNYSMENYAYYAAKVAQQFGQEAKRQLDAYVARRPAGDPLAAQVQQAWNEDSELPDDKERHLDNLHRLLPVYFRDFEEIEPRLADWFTLMDLTIDPNRQPSEWDIRDRLSEIDGPVLVIVGAYDFICGEKWARQLHDGIAGSELVVLSGSGHFGHLEEPEEFFGSVLRFAAAH